RDNSKTRAHPSRAHPSCQRTSGPTTRRVPAPRDVLLPPVQKTTYQTSPSRVGLLPCDDRLRMTDYGWLLLGYQNNSPAPTHSFRQTPRRAVIIFRRAAICVFRARVRFHRAENADSNNICTLPWRVRSRNV